MKKRACLLWLVLVVLVGCGGGHETPFTIPSDVKSVSPADGATGVALNVYILATLNEEIDPASLSDASFKVSHLWSSFIAGSFVTEREAVTGSLSSAGKQIFFKPAGNFLPEANYLIVVLGLKTISGKVIAAFAWSFKTGNDLDVTPPLIVTVSPANGVSAATGSVISAIFNKAIDPAVNSNMFKLVNSDTSLAVSGTITVSDNIVSLMPDANLATSSHYQATAQNFKDLFGNAVATYVWNFSTVAEQSVTRVTLATANWVPYSKGGNTQATFDKNTGKVMVNIAGEASDVSVRWDPLNLVKGEPYLVSFPCSSVPQRDVVVQLKKNGGDYYAYDSVAVACTGTVTIQLVPDGNDTAGRLNINFGAAAGVYTVGTVTVQY